MVVCKSSSKITHNFGQYNKKKNHYLHDISDVYFIQRDKYLIRIFSAHCLRDTLKASKSFWASMSSLVTDGMAEASSQYFIARAFCPRSL